MRLTSSDTHVGADAQFGISSSLFEWWHCLLALLCASDFLDSFLGDGHCLAICTLILICIFMFYLLSSCASLAWCLCCRILFLDLHCCFFGALCGLHCGCNGSLGLALPIVDCSLYNFLGLNWGHQVFRGWRQGRVRICSRFLTHCCDV